MRKRIYRLVEADAVSGRTSDAYDIFMMLAIVVSIVPLAFKGQPPVFVAIDRVAAGIFAVDYLLRLYTADLKYPNLGWRAFLIYPFTPLAIVDLLAILPSLYILGSGFRLLKLFRFLRSLRVLRALKMLRYSRNVTIILNVFKKQRKAFACVGSLAAAYILVSALVVFNVEPDSFDNSFTAIYWATVSLTTVGYGDIYPVTTIGRIVAMVSSIFGIAVVALPAGIITAGYMGEVSSRADDQRVEPLEGGE